MRHSAKFLKCRDQRAEGRAGLLRLLGWGLGVLLSVSVLGGRSEVDAGGLALTAEVKTMGGEAARIFAVDEPVWIMLTLRNDGSGGMNLVVDDDGYQGGRCRLSSDYRGSAREIVAPVRADFSMSHIVLPVGGVLTTEFPLAEFVAVREDGQVPLVVSMSVRDTNFASVTVTTTSGVEFAGRLGGERLQTVRRQLGRLLTAGDEETRMRGVRSLRAMKDEIAAPLLRKAIEDPCERVRLVAVRVAGEFAQRGGDRSILEKATGDSSEWVRRAAQRRLDMLPRKP